MKNKLKKYAAIGTIAIMGLLLTNTAVEKTVTLISDTDTSCVTTYSGGENQVGAMTMHIGFLKKMRLMPRFMIAYKITIFPHRSLKQ